MSSVRRADLERELRAKLRDMPPADWVREMIDHYQKTGTYRAQDLRRLLGDPNQSVKVGPDGCLPSFLSNRTP